jgi:hypothetical protein
MFSMVKSKECQVDAVLNVATEWYSHYRPKLRNTQTTTSRNRVGISQKWSRHVAIKISPCHPDKCKRRATRLATICAQNRVLY